METLQKKYGLWTATSMVVGALVISEFAQRIESANGIVDYYEKAYGKRIGYLMGWFNGILYYSPLSAILAWISATYTLLLFNIPQGNDSKPLWIIAFIYILITYIMNNFAPPVLAILGSSIIIYGGITNPSIGFYLIISITIILFGLLFFRE